MLAVFANQVSNAGIALFMAMCGFGFGLFQTPNNSILISSAPQNRSGGASGMLGMARLTGQTTGASLVALMFVVFLFCGRVCHACRYREFYPGFFAGTGDVNDNEKEEGGMI